MGTDAVNVNYYLSDVTTQSLNLINDFANLLQTVEFAASTGDNLSN